MTIYIDSEITEKTAADFIEQTKTLDDNEKLELEITSEGGSVTAGNVIVSKIRELSKSGHETTAHVISLAASMASVIACACDNLVLDSNAFLMIHEVWTCVQGNSTDLRREAETLDLFTRSLLSVYRNKFHKTDDEILSMLKAETWILGEQAKEYGLVCDVVDVGSEIKIAAKINQMNFKNLPKVLNMTDEEKKTEVEEEKTGEEVENTESVEEEKTVENPVEEIETEEEKPTYEELEERIKELEKEIDELKQPVEKRVSGMQSKMQAKINALDLDYKNRISEFENQLMAKSEELEAVKNESINLKSSLEKVEAELSEKVSTLEQKELALAQLSQGVLSQPTEKKPHGWGNLSGDDFKAYLKANGNILKITNR